jgi:arylsulfatase A
MNVDKRYFAAIVAIFALFSPMVADAEKTSPPNFVIVLVDDLGYGDVGCYGSRQNKTPNIDRVRDRHVWQMASGLQAALDAG